MLLMTNEAGAFGAPLFLVTLCTVIHLHSIPGILLVSSDIPAPDIPAVFGEAIILVRPYVL